jgi:hypothetical protein
LKKSVFRKTAKISGIENVYPRRERRLQGFLTQSFSGHFSGSEFFKSHRPFRSLTQCSRRTTSEWLASSLSEGFSDVDWKSDKLDSLEIETEGNSRQRLKTRTEEIKPAQIERGFLFVLTSVLVNSK